ncbi:spore cortex biosynthesis protein YabQ [Paenibacillus woosongensis]|uniref:Spore cortex biosynthesis protein YabQ n=1 Tax=Paenibacillus woosongensis TaxID=307580 RepID=A0A7X2Z7A8_9BACL|nr:spore cortex biosynthesis protein YabQ [Paenibacillus woosongensis]MUG48206.1 spore cortex biosynthesis protein YabQ [Paenibacillus woosongensis]
MNLEVQWATLLWMAVSGGILGIAFDSYRVVSGQLRFPRWSVHALDLLYWVAASLFVFRMLYHSNQGDLRFYVFLGLFIGVWIYFLFLSVITARFVVMLMRIVKKIYLISVRIFRIFIIAPIIWLLKGIKLLLGFAWVILLFMGRITLLPIWKLLLWALRPLIRKLRIIELAVSVRDRITTVWKRWFGRKED